MLSYTTVDVNAIARCALFLMRATTLIWVWIYIDASVRRAYVSDVERIVKEIRAGVSTPLERAKRACDRRNKLVQKWREKTSPLGIIGVTRLKPNLDEFTFTKMLERYTGERLFTLLDPNEQDQVLEEFIKGAVRPNTSVTDLMNCLGRLARDLMAVAIVTSIYLVIVADGWKDELGRQVASWCMAILISNVASGIGTRDNPVGRILGAVVGGIMGNLAAKVIYSTLAFGKTW